MEARNIVLDNSKQGQNLNGFSHVLIEFKNGYPDMLLISKEECNEAWDKLSKEEKKNIEHIYSCRMLL